MINYIKKLQVKLKFNEFELLRGAILYLICVYINHFWISISLILILFIVHRNLKILFILLGLFTINIKNDKIIVKDVKSTYSIVSINNEHYYLKSTLYNFYDEIEAEYTVETLEDTDFNQFLINRDIHKKIVINKVILLKKSKHLKSYLYNYIKTNYKDDYAQFLLSVFFDFKIQNFIFYSLHFHILTVLLILKKYNQYLALGIGLFFLYFDFKLIVLLQVISILLMYSKLKKDEIFAIQCIISTFIFRESIFSISFYYFFTFKIINLFYHQYKLNRFILLLYSIIFFKQISVLSLLFYRKLKYIITINSVVTLLLIFFPKYCMLYINFIKKMMFSDIKINHTIPIFVFLLLLVMLLFIKNKKWKIGMYVLLLIPNHFYFYQEIIFIPYQNHIITIIKPNFLSLPIVINEVDEYILNKHGIQQYKHSDESIRQYHTNTIIYLNDFYTINEGINPYYKIIPFEFYVTDKLDESILNSCDVKYVIYFNYNDYQGKDEIKLLSRKVNYLSINKTVKIIYFLGFRFIVH